MARQAVKPGESIPAAWTSASGAEVVQLEVWQQATRRFVESLDREARALVVVLVLLIAGRRSEHHAPPGRAGQVDP